METPQLVAVCFPQDTEEAGQFREALAHEDIECFIQGETLSARTGMRTRPTMQSPQLRLLVRTADVGRATVVIENAEWPMFGQPGDEDE